jgi:SNF2 family DNA or RNA helicase
MLLYHDGRRYVCKSLYTERALPKSAGFRWDPQAKVWWTDKDANAWKLVGYADSATKLLLKRSIKGQSKSLSLSRAVDANVEIPAPGSLQYLPFQRAGIAYALSRPAVLIGDEMGLGKTVEAIGVINAGPKPERVLIICPASLKGNWAREFSKWTTHKVSIGIATSKEPWPPDHVVIVNYDILDRFEKEIAGTVFDYLIVDECHYVKNSNTKRAAYVLGRAKKGTHPSVEPIKAHKRMFMSGTPIVNRPKELWSIIHSLDPKRWTSFFKYAMRYCGAYHNGWGWDFSGSSNLGELQTTLRSTILVRRLKSEVLKELPDKVRQVIELPSNGAKKLVEAEWEAWRAHKDRVEELQKRIEEAAVLKDVDTYRVAVKALQSEMVIAFSEMAKVRHDTAVAKIPMVVEHLTNVLESGNKAVVFVWHHDVVDALAKEFEGVSVVIDGRVPPSKRIELVDAFQMNPKIKLFIGSITAAGVGITLTAASHVIFAELDWVPGNVSQAEDRLHRIGQKDCVLVQHLVLEESLDAHMAKVIVKKQEVIEKALDKESIAVPREKKSLVTMSNPKKEDWVEKAYKAPPKKSPTTVAWYSSSDVLEALKFLADRCDGARSMDGHGFNKFDTAFGKDLAARNFLTPGQVEAGVKLVRKYRKQLPERLREKLDPV